MTPAETLAVLERAEAVLSGHFLLSSGLHSDRYVQCALATRDPADGERLGAGIAALFKGESISLVVGPALGGVIIAYEVARALKVPNIFAERLDGAMAIRRGFAVKPSDRVVIVEDVFTTGKSTMEVAALVTAAGATLVGFGSIVDRTGGVSKLTLPPRSLTTLTFKTYQAAECPLCATGSKAIKPGSRPQP
jgi:orotate phosphoribosyltransferase